MDENMSKLWGPWFLSRPVVRDTDVAIHRAHFIAINLYDLQRLQLIRTLRANYTSELLSRAVRKNDVSAFRQGDFVPLAFDAAKEGII